MLALVLLPFSISYLDIQPLYATVARLLDLEGRILPLLHSEQRTSVYSLINVSRFFNWAIGTELSKYLRYQCSCDGVGV